MDESLSIDDNNRNTLGALTNDSNQYIRNLRVNPITGALLVTAVLPPSSLAIGDTIAGGTQGSVLFVGPGGTLDQDNAEFFWDDTNFFLGLGTDAPANTIHVVGTAQVTGSVGTSTTLWGADGAGQFSNVTVGAGLTLAANVLSAAASANAYNLIQNQGVSVTQRTTINLTDLLAASDVGGKTQLDIDVANLATDATFITDLIANNTFTTDLANNSNFISTLTSNATFQTDIIDIVTASPYLSLENNGTPNSSQTVLNLVNGSNITITDLGAGAISIASTGSSGITSINADTTAAQVLEGTSGDISVTDLGGGVHQWDLVATAVTPGSYTNTNLTVDGFGRITAASSGSSISGVGVVYKDGTHTSDNSGSANVVLNSTTILANTYATGNILRAKIHYGMQASGASENATITVKYGATTIFNFTLDVDPSLSPYKGEIDVVIYFLSDTTANIEPKNFLQNNSGPNGTISYLPVYNTTIADITSNQTWEVLCTTFNSTDYSQVDYYDTSIEIL